MATSRYIRSNLPTEENQSDTAFRKRIIILTVISGMIMTGMYFRPVMIAAAVALGIYLLFLPCEHGLEALFFIISFENIFKYSRDSTSIFTILQIIPILKMLLTEDDIKISRRCTFSLLCLAVYILLFSFNGIAVYLKIVIGIALLIGVFRTPVAKRIHCTRLLIMYSLGIILSGLFAMANPEIVEPYVSALVVRLDDNTAIDRFSGMYMNANYYSMEISLALAGHVVLFRSGEEKPKIVLVLSLLLLFLGIKTQSKTFVITVAMMAVTMICFTAANRPDRLYLLLVGFVIIGVIFRKQLGEFIETYFSRIVSLQGEDASMTDVTTGRSDIWQVYIRAIFSDGKILLFGNGIETRAYGLAPHNMFIEAVFCLGLIGCGLYINVLFNIRQKITKRRASLIFALVLFVRAFAANIAFYNNVYYYMILLFILSDGDNAQIPVKKKETAEKTKKYAYCRF